MQDSTTAPRTATLDSSQAVFASGSLLRHILVMTMTATIGLVAIFAGDLVNMMFLSLLRDTEVVAAVGYASPLLFISVSVGIGLSIAGVATVSPALGRGDRARARQLSASMHALTFVVTMALAAAFWVLTPTLLAAIGATGRTADLATDYLRIQLPTTPAMCLGMTAAAVLRSVGDARRAMYVTLGGAAVNTALDPILIFGAGLGLNGAAIASAISRFAIMAIGLWAVIRIHDLMAKPTVAATLDDIKPLAFVALPAILTNVATPIANGYVTAAFAPFGDGAVAGWAVISRIMPLAFGFMFALSAAVGPIIGQNLGAGRAERMLRTVTLSLAVTAAYTAVAWLLLAGASAPIVWLFGAKDTAADLILLFCRWLAPLFGALGALFVANAVFNTLGRAHIATLLNWGRATLGTIPFVVIGAHLWGAPGVLTGNMAGGLVFAALGVWLAYRRVRQVARPA
jgi:putative MATE family efflux protein